MQDGFTLAHVASGCGRTETLALLLANKADINAADKVQQFNIFKSLLLIDKKPQGYLIGLYECHQRF
jgi:hypothetical protein